jgi:hypothetical protein
MLAVIVAGGTILVSVADDNTKEEKEEAYVAEDPPEEGDLPVMSINTYGQEIDKDVKIWSDMTLVDNEVGINSVEDEATFETAITLKYRGHSSYYTFDKKSYRIEFVESMDSTKEVTYDLFGMAPDSEWVLYGPFLDRTLLRNNLMYSISREIMNWAPDSRYFELYLDGEYQGVYLAVEPVTNGEYRLQMSTLGLLSGQTSYILKWEREGTELNALTTYGKLNGYTSHEISIIYPSEKNITDAQYRWIENDIDYFEEVLYSDYFDDPEIGYAAYIDVDSFVDYYILNEVAMIADAGELSTYVYKEIGGNYQITVWDFNNAFDNYPEGEADTERFYLTDANWFARLVQDRAFVDKVIERYKELRQGILSDEEVMERIDNEIAYLDGSIEENFEVWGYTFHEHLLSKDVNGEVRDPSDYDEAVDQLKDCYEERTAYLDNNFDLLYEYCIN